MAWFVSRRNCPSCLTANTVAGPLDNSHRSGRAGADHQDPPTTLLLYRRTAHPPGAPPHPASATALALGNPTQSRPGPIASHFSSSLPASSATGPPTSPTSYPNVPQTRARPASERLLLRPAPHRGAPCHHRRPSTDANCPKSTRQSRLHASHIPFQYRHPAVRWIRA